MSPPVLVGIHYRSRNRVRACVHTEFAKIWAGKASKCRDIEMIECSLSNQSEAERVY